jgi:hypothetical protein
MRTDFDLAIHKPLWSRRPDGHWAIHDVKGIRLMPKMGCSPDFFAFESDMELMTTTPPTNLHDLFASFGSTDFLVKQSILPVVAWVDGEDTVRCIGTAFVVSASGYVITASHVLLDPQESGYGKVDGRVGQREIQSGLLMGVIIPVNPATGVKAFNIVPFVEAWYWGKWEESPLLHEGKKLNRLTDVAICKLPERTDGSAYQALNLSLFPFEKGEGAFAIGYAKMKDIPVEYIDSKPKFGEFNHELCVSFGEVTELYPDNHIKRAVPTPGPSFDFQARIPGRMSGAPIFGAQGAIIRGVVSRSFQDEKHASGCMIGPIMTLPFGEDNKSLKKLMDAGTEGIAVVRGKGL